MNNTLSVTTHPVVSLSITDNGMVLNSSDPIETMNWSHVAEGSLPYLRWVPMLLEQGLAEQTGETTLLISNNRLFTVLEMEEAGELLGFCDILPPPSPYTLELKNTAYLASKNLAFEYAFFRGAHPEFPKRTGCFLETGDQHYRLSSEMFQLLEAVDAFNILPVDQKGTAENLRHFAHIKLFCNRDTVSLTPTLENETAVIPQRFGIGLEIDENARLSLTPKVAGVDPDILKQAFYRHGDGQAFYHLQMPGGERVRIVIPEEMQQAFTHMRRHLTGLTGKERDEALLNPLSAFEGVCPAERIELDDWMAERAHLNLKLADYGPRVKEIGPYVFQPVPRLRRVSCLTFLDQVEPPGGFELVLGGENSAPEHAVKNREEAEDLLQQAEDALARGQPTIVLSGESGHPVILPVSASLIDQLRQTVETWKVSVPEGHPEKTAPVSPQKETGDAFLIIEDEYVEQTIQHKDLTLVYERPGALIETLTGQPFELKSFQQAGVTWLQSSFRCKRSGVLLADDMGLGKTLQVLTFLAWLIETGKPEAFPPEPPYDAQQPILIVAPVILLENWKNEIEKFFAHHGSVFHPFLILNSQTIRSFIQNPEKRGREYKVGEPLLDLERLRNHRVIITNYDTVKNYQLSLGRIQWTALIADEAQAIKNEKTAVTFAMKALASNAHFKIAMSGTPIENGLMDLWCDHGLHLSGPPTGNSQGFCPALRIPGNSGRFGWR